MNYQFRHGTSFWETAGILYKQGGIGRFYSACKTPKLLYYN
jgi:hypothetical protein